MAALLTRRVVPLALAAAAALAPPAAATHRERIERAVRSQAPDAKLVRQTFVRLHDPLPTDAGPHPRACDWISYLRFRNARAPRHPARADAVLAIMPGFLGGAASFDQVAVVRQAVRD